MTFEEFFKKKRIDLDVLEKGEPALFSEFKTHYHQMGEKSFDHTKKYWFNKLRLQFPLAVEIKTEKPKIENQLAEQTITESLIESAAQPTVASKHGFTPRFKAANLPKPVIEDKPEPAESATDVPSEIASAENKPPQAIAPKHGFTPRFKAANSPKPVVEDKPTAVEPTADAPPETPAENKPPQPYKPRFNMKNIPPKPTEE